MLRPIALVLSLAALGGCIRANANSAGAPQSFRIVDPSTQDGSLTDVLQREAARAKAAGLRPYVEISAVWCGPCRRLKEALVDPRIQEALRGAYIIRLEYDPWQEQLASAGLPVKTIPVFFQLSPEGKPTGRSMTGEAWNEDSPESMAPVLRTFFTSGG